MLVDWYRREKQVSERRRSNRKWWIREACYCGHNFDVHDVVNILGFAGVECLACGCDGRPAREDIEIRITFTKGGEA